MSKIVVKIQNTKTYKSAHVVIIHDENILILKRSDTDDWMPGHYGLPGGKLEQGEDLLQGACRECKEETSLDIFPQELVFLPKCSIENSHAFFLTTKYNGKVKLDFEHDDYKWINPKNLSNYKIVPDLLSIVAEAWEKINSVER
jgi:8-oxo-dGTP pyrophosphatase MutT (NUDIX family)